MLNQISNLLRCDFWHLILLGRLLSAGHCIQVMISTYFDIHCEINVYPEAFFVTINYLIAIVTFAGCGGRIVGSLHMTQTRSIIKLFVSKRLKNKKSTMISTEVKRSKINASSSNAWPKSITFTCILLCSMFAGVYSDHSCGVIGDYGEMLHQCPKNSCCDLEKAKSDPYMVQNDKECCTQEVIGDESDPDCCSCAICGE